MKLFGFTSENGTPIFLEQVTLEADAKSLREVAEFLLQCSSEIENDEEWDHEHLSDYLETVLDQELVVYNSNKA